MRAALGAGLGARNLVEWRRLARAAAVLQRRCDGRQGGLAPRGHPPPGGIPIATGASYAFRPEPSGGPARLQMFHMHELVRIAEPETVVEWREWISPAIDYVCPCPGLGTEPAFGGLRRPATGAGSAP